MKAVLSSRGSRGDVHPIIEIAARLKKRGHNVHICVPDHFKDFATRQQIDVSLYDEDSRKLMKGLGSGLGSVKSAMTFFANSIEQQFHFMLEATRDADVLITTVNELSAPTVAEYRKIPHFRITFAPALPGNHPPPFSPWQNMPVFLNRLGWSTLSFLSGVAIRKFINGKRTELGLSPVRNSNAYHTGRSHTLLAINSELAPPCSSWVGKYNYDYTGYCYGQIDGPLDRELLDFIDQGPPPVYVGFGSVHIKNPSKFTQMVADAASRVGCRIVFGQGWTGLGEGHLQENIFSIGDSNHGTLFKKMAGIIHHGGSGTTHTAARAGIPQFILPQIVDQYYWGNRIHKMGLGPSPVLPRKVKPAVLLKAFMNMTNGMYRNNALELSARMEKEDGVEKSTQIILKKIHK